MNAKPKEAAMGSVGTHYNDADRVRLATRRDNTMLGPSERAHCDHGKIYSYRWTWRVGETPETGECEYISQRCKKCGPPAED